MRNVNKELITFRLDADLGFILTMRNVNLGAPYVDYPVETVLS